MLEISEIFYSLQGEGPFMGKPAVFVRLTRCIAPFCNWCDSMHACTKPGEKIAVNEAFNQIKQHKCNLIVITGGEPFLQWDNGLNELEAKLIKAGFQVQYETSGKVKIPSDSEGYVVCSPKFVQERWRFIPENINKIDAFKFVVKEQFERTEKFIQEYKIPNHRVWIMPLGATREEQLTLMSSIWDYSAKHEYNFAPRLHTLAFNDKRGV